MTTNLIALTPLALIPLAVIAILGLELYRAVRGARKRVRSNRRIIASYGPGYGLLAWDEEWKWQEPQEE